MMNNNRTDEITESNQDCNFFDTLNSKAINYNIDPEAIEQTVKNKKKDVTIIKESYCPSSSQKILEIIKAGFRIKLGRYRFVRSIPKLLTTLSIVYCIYYLTHNALPTDLAELLTPYSDILCWSIFWWQKIDIHSESVYCYKIDNYRLIKHDLSDLRLLFMELQAIEGIKPEVLIDKNLDKKILRIKLVARKK